MGPNQFGRAASLQNHRVDQVSRSSHPATSISISKVSSMSCDIRPLCGELTHPRRLIAQGNQGSPVSPLPAKWRWGVVGIRDSYGASELPLSRTAGSLSISMRKGPGLAGALGVGV